MKRRVPRQTLSVALFPFLAVLICTMGVLIVLLVLFTHQARVEAKSIADQYKAAAPATSDDRQLREQLEDAKWRRDLLEQQRAEKTAELADSRARLSHLEDHLQKLQRRAAELMARAREIDEGERLDDGQLAATRAELARLQADISRKEIDLDQARREQAEQEKWYALIPYDGPQGTRRRPIYLECTDQGIVLQPEGLVFRPEDFNGPMGPGNPLDAALRTIREYLQQAGGRNAGEPYPLLVVRPSGVVAYGAARTALKAWDDEFGYELISDDKKLVYGEADLALAAALQRSVGQARLRQAALAAAMPRKFDDEPLTSFDPASVPSIAAVTSTPGGRGFGSSGRSGFGGFGDATAGGPSLGAPAGGAGAAGSGSTAGPYSAAGQPGPAGATQSTASSGSTAAGSNTGAGAASGSQPGGMAVSGNPTTGQQQPVPGGSVAFGPGAASRGPSQVRAGAGRGSNWGLPGAGARSTGITRPLHVAVLLDRLVVIPEKGDDRPQQSLAVPDRLRDADIEAFVAAVQKEMKSWGLAVEGGYWKPLLEVHVAPDAEHHFADLQTALQNSGFALHRKTP